jgi:hypothetical protein
MRSQTRPIAIYYYSSKHDKPLDYQRVTHAACARNAIRAAVMRVSDGIAETAEIFGENQSIVARVARTKRGLLLIKF